MGRVRGMETDADNKRLSYVTYQDIRSVGNFADQTVMAVKAPPDTRLEVPDPKQSLQIWLKSQNGAIEVYLCPDGENDGTEDSASNDGLIKPKIGAELLGTDSRQTTTST